MLKKITPNLIICILVLFNLVLGVFLAPDFGRTGDERIELETAAAALHAYTPGSFGKYSDNDIDPIDRFYGTAMTMLALLAENIFQPLLGTDQGVVAHYSYFVFFQIGIVSIYFLAKKFIDPWGALIVGLLFATQPLFFGHAFFNPKDTPLLSMFLAAVTTGIYMTDHLAARLAENQEQNQPLWSFDLPTAWQNTPQKDKKLLLYLQILWPGLLVLYLLTKKILPVLVDAMFQAESGSFIGNLFTRLVAQPDSADAAAYINKVLHLNQSLFQVLAVVAAVSLLWTIFRKITGLWPYLAEDWLKPVMNDFRPKRLIGYLTDWHVLAAGFVWGWSISTRVVAIFAGLMVGLYLVLKINKRSIAPLFVYSLVSITITYLSLPPLWINGFSMLSRGLKLFSSYSWNGDVYFHGQVFKAADLPSSYLPFFISTQLTEPVVILAMIGLAVGLIKAVRKREDWQLVSVVAAWFVLPFIYILISHPKLYNNCRQFLFILPPLFIFAGIALQTLTRKINPWILKGVLYAAVLFPGILAIIQLHPYQYVYFNQFVGGVKSAYRQYETDYWNLSAKEAVEYLNQTAAPNSSVIVWGFPGNVEFYSRKDLVIVFQGKADQNISSYDYAIINTHFNADLYNLTDRETIYTIERSGAILSVVKVLGETP